jgi:hypothetical protein
MVDAKVFEKVGGPIFTIGLVAYVGGCIVVTLNPYSAHSAPSQSLRLISKTPVGDSMSIINPMELYSPLAVNNTKSGAPTIDVRTLLPSGSSALGKV